MSLAFALMAAINGSTGSCATLSHGLSLPHQASPASARRPRKILTPQGWRRKGPPGTLSQKGFLSGMFNTIPVCRRTSLKVAASRDSFSRRM
jgi:hypothetical protein